MEVLLGYVFNFAKLLGARQVCILIEAYKGLLVEVLQDC